MSDGVIREFITDGGAIDTFVKSTGQDEHGELYFLTGINVGPLPDEFGTTYGKVMRVVPSVTDTDGDGILNGSDLCDGFDDTLDSDNDGIPDGCDLVIPDSNFASVWDSTILTDPFTGIYPITGSGQINGNFTIDTFDGGISAIEIGLRA